jgi:hypothetical protein
MDGVLGILVVLLGLLFIGWLCGPARQGGGAVAHKVSEAQRTRPTWKRRGGRRNQHRE